MMAFGMSWMALMSASRSIPLRLGDALFEPLEFNLQKVRARGGKLYVLPNQDVRVTEARGPVICMSTPIGHTLMLQCANRCANSVTVE